MSVSLGMLASANPLEHVVEHPLKTVSVDLGGWPLTPKGEITVMSDQIVMLIVAGVLLLVFLPGAVK